MTETTNTAPDVEDFADPTPVKSPKQKSTAAKVRQAILFVVLAVCLVGLGWEFLVARAGYQRVYGYLENLEEEFNSASTIETVGDEQGQGINEIFLADRVREVIGMKPKKTDSFNEGSAVIEYYEWRRGNLYEVYDLAVQFRKQGPNGTMVFADWYDELEEIPVNPAGAIEVDMDKALPPQAPNVTGGVGLGGNSDGAEGRRRRSRDESEENSTDEGAGTDEPEGGEPEGGETDSTQGEGEGEASQESDGDGETSSDN